MPGERGPPLAPITPSVASVTFTCSRFEPLVQKLRRALREDLDQRHDVARTQAAHLAGELQVVDEVACARGGNCGGVVSSSPSTTCERRSSWSSYAG